MSRFLSAVDANRRFSALLRAVREGETFVVTSQGRPVARLVPAPHTLNVRSAARDLPVPRLERQPASAPPHLDPRRTLRGRTAVKIALDTNILIYAEGLQGAAG